ncbi:hypothetical protein Mgra_00006768 [Meloidogyne graminicola]|uniref:Uncharacterized protein n=1 Tax=Meloidogyne graminicola TaxID=189291 RepID=A0A8S9ZKC2_9BILA|nr:hypothetical protein Mgra_00006768 [Meloidogyne graminicola]
MALIATVYPYKNENNMSYNHRKQSSSSASTDREQPYSGIFRIEDVTDDPRYANLGNEGNSALEKEEGALVEYCRSKVVNPSVVINQPPQVVRRPSFSTSSVLRTTKPPENERRGRQHNKTQAIEANILARAAAGFTSQNQQRSSSRPPFLLEGQKARFTPLNVKQPLTNIPSVNRNRTLAYAFQVPSTSSITAT